MTNILDTYRDPNLTLPEDNHAWNLYGAGIENVGKDGKPETFDLPKPSDEQILVRVDTVGMCFSDVKLIKFGRNHPKLYNRDMRKEPTRLGHEAAVTVIKVGDKLKNKFKAGERYAVQPDIYQNGKSTAYGYTIPGGLIQYHLMGKEMWDTDAGMCLLPLNEEMGYAESALLEPWGCVMASYTQRRRLEPKEGGIMWILGRDGDNRDYSFAKFLDAPATILMSNVPDSLRQQLLKTGANLMELNDVSSASISGLSKALTNGAGFDDIVMLDPRSGERVSEVAKTIARRGTLNMVGTKPLDSKSSSDVGRLHYDYIAFIGTNGTEISASYGEARNRCELANSGSAVFVGAGGPMGQMHVQRALELPTGPKLVIATEVNQMRLDAIQDNYGPLAKQNGRTLLTMNPMTSDMSLPEFVAKHTDGKGVDDVIISVPFAGLMEEGADLMNENGMLVLFAGVPNGTMAPLDLSNVYMHNAQYTGTSGLTIHDQSAVMDSTISGTLSPNRSVAAIGGINAAQDGVVAMMEGSFPGKIVIFPQIEELELVGLDKLADAHPDVAKHLGEGNTWNAATEEALLAKFWKPA